ncbi:helix-turn-helix domain-containing protein [Syntrophomonas wolfei]|uniref:helix-turn-helix domain-containing protein n=1 Tax=Syntrophomonas wolfei TaxID=863 RepID=UPI0034CE02ED
MANTDMNINQIAELVGYKDAGYFSKLFCRSTGLLPNQYRKLEQSQQRNFPLFAALNYYCKEIVLPLTSSTWVPNYLSSYTY